MRLTISAVVMLVMAFSANIVYGQFERRIQGIPQAIVGPSPNGVPAVYPQSQFPVWQIQPPVGSPPQFLGNSSNIVPTRGGRVTSVYSPPTQRVLPATASPFQGNSIIPLRVSPGQFSNGGFNVYSPVASPRREPLTNVYRPPSSRISGNANWVNPSSAPVPVQSKAPAQSQVKVSGAIDAAQLNEDVDQDGGGTTLRFPASATSQFVFELDGISYKINPGGSVNLSAGKERSLRFPAGPGLGDRIATLKPNESYAFDFRGEEGWVLIPDVPSKPLTNPILPTGK